MASLSLDSLYSQAAAGKCRLGPFSEDADPYGGRVSSVRRGSLAQRAGLRAGDTLLALNGHRLRDIIDYRFYAAEERLELEVRRGDESLTLWIERGYGEGLGLAFEEVVFDGLRLCRNHCPFCFVDQLPPGMRSSLYIKDDDYRCSFLWGNFITLSNWSEGDWERVGEQRLSPLYVSVHATDLGLRRKILGNPRLPDIGEQLHRLGDLGIQVHAQVVLVPGLNDGAELRRTVSELAGLYPIVQSIGVVPVGLTNHHKVGLRTVTVSEAKALVEAVHLWRREFHAGYGSRLVHLADEFYLLAGLPFPLKEAYESFPQLENGIGLVRMLLDEGEEVTRQAVGRRAKAEKATLICGTLVSPVLKRVAEKLSRFLSTQIEVLAVENRFFGPTVTVSGLLTGRDVVASLRRRDLGEMVCLPRSMFDASGERTLDGLTLEGMEGTLGVRVAMAGEIGEVVDLLI